MKSKNTFTFEYYKNSKVEKVSQYYILKYMHIGLYILYFQKEIPDGIIFQFHAGCDIM